MKIAYIRDTRKLMKENGKMDKSTKKESKFIQTEQFIKVLGRMGIGMDMDMEDNNMWMGLFTKVTGKMIKNKDKENIFSVTEPMLANLRTIKNMETDIING